MIREIPAHELHTPPESRLLTANDGGLVRNHHRILLSLGAIALLASCENNQPVPTALARTASPLENDITTVDPSNIPPQGPYEAINLGTLGGANGQAQGINNNGMIIGTAQEADGSSHPFLWQNHVMQALDSGGNGFTSALAINDQGVIAGIGKIGGTSYAMTWINGTVQTLGPLAPFTRVFLNQLGDVAWTGPTPAGPHAFRWHAGVAQDLGTLGGPSSQALAINDAGQVMGKSSTGSRDDVFVWKDGQMRDAVPPIAGASSMTAVDINNRGWILGRATFGTDFPFITVSWLWDGDSVTMIPSLPAPDTSGFAIALTQRGDVYGVDEDREDIASTPFRYSHGTIAPLNPGVTNETMFAVSNTGIAAGYVYVGNHIHAVATDANNSWDLGVLGGLNFRNSDGIAVDNSGDVVGESTWFGRSVPTLWQRVTK